MIGKPSRFSKDPDLLDDPAETEDGMYLSALADGPGEAEAAMALNALLDEPERLAREADYLIEKLKD